MPKKLTKEQRKEVWKPSEENAGAGWKPRENTGQISVVRSCEGIR